MRNTRAMSIIDISDGTCAHPLGPTRSVGGTTSAAPPPRTADAHEHCCCCCGRYGPGRSGLPPGLGASAIAVEHSQSEVRTHQLKVAAEAQKLRQADRRVLHSRGGAQQQVRPRRRRTKHRWPVCASLRIQSQRCPPFAPRHREGFPAGSAPTRGLSPTIAPRPALRPRGRRSGPSAAAAAAAAAWSPW